MSNRKKKPLKPPSFGSSSPQRLSQTPSPSPSRSSDGGPLSLRVANAGLSVVDGSVRISIRCMQHYGLAPGIVVVLYSSSASHGEAEPSPLAIAEALLSQDVDATTIAVSAGLAQSALQNIPNVVLRRYNKTVPSLPFVTLKSCNKSDNATSNHVTIASLRAQYNGRLIVPNQNLGPYIASLAEGLECGRITATTAWREDVSYPLGKQTLCEDLHVEAIAQVRGVVASLMEGGANSLQGCGILLVGQSGVGKSIAIQRAVEGHTVLPLSVHDNSRTEDVLTRVLQTAPCVVVLEDVDVAEQSAITTQLRRYMEVWRGHRVAVILSVCDAGVIDASLRRVGLLGTTVELLPPFTPAQREVLLRSMAGSSSFLHEAIHHVSSVTHGYTVKDLGNVLRYAHSSAILRGVQQPSAQDLTTAVRHVRPSLLRNMDVSIPTTTWGDIGGQAPAKACLQECVKWLTTHSETLTRFGIRAPRGVLLYGPPGCSKTMMAKALANESGMNFLSVKGPELLSKWVGDSEKAVREVFTKARSVAPCIVFFDELDGLCSTRGKGGVGDRVICQLLTEMDGLQSTSKTKCPNPILVVAATNRPDVIDPALLRPGRFDHRVHVGLPGPEEREQIFCIALREVPTHQEVSIATLVGATEGYSGAECVAVCKEAALWALEEDMSCTVLKQHHFITALGRVKPRQKQ